MFLIQNVDDWVTKHSGLTYDSYGKDVCKLLDSESREGYDLLLNLLKKEWDDSFLAYYTQHLDTDIKSTFRPLLEELGIYYVLSGITNNPAESTNAKFKKVLPPEKCSFFQAVSCWYFYQGVAVSKISRGILQDGGYPARDPISPRIYVPRPEDSMDEEMIPYLFRNGKAPIHMTKNEAYKSPPIQETITLRGQAEFLISEPGRVLNVPMKKVWLVTGFLEKQFMVSKSG